MSGRDVASDPAEGPQGDDALCTQSRFGPQERSQLLCLVGGKGFGWGKAAQFVGSVESQMVQCMRRYMLFFDHMAYTAISAHTGTFQL